MPINYGNHGLITPIKETTGAVSHQFDLEISNLFSATLSGNASLGVSNPQAGTRFVVKLIQDAMGSRTVTWFSSIKWPNGEVPVLTKTANKADIFSFICTSTGNYDGFIVAKNI